MRNPCCVCTQEGRKTPVFADYRRLNLETVADTYPFQRLYYYMDSLGDGSVLTSLVAKCGYWQIPILEADGNMNRFTTHGGTQRYSTTPFGFRNAPTDIQRDGHNSEWSPLAYLTDLPR